MTETISRKYKWGILSVRANWAESSSPIRYATDDAIGENEYSFTPFQVAAASHSPQKALALVNEWLKLQG